MVSNGVDRSKIFVLHNTIDITSQRSLFDKLIQERERLRSEAGLNGKNVLLFVGRLTGRKQLNFLFDAFHVLRKTDESYHLMIIGGGETINLLHSLRKKCGDTRLVMLVRLG